MSTILEFIRVFDSPSNRILFTECACYWFASILHERFTNASIVYDPHQVHFATKIQGKIYDITGLIEDDSEYVDWEEYADSSQDASLIIESCIYLKGGEY